MHSSQLRNVSDSKTPTRRPADVAQSWVERDPDVPIMANDRGAPQRNSCHRKHAEPNRSHRCASPVLHFLPVTIIGEPHPVNRKKDIKDGKTNHAHANLLDTNMR